MKKALIAVGIILVIILIALFLRGGNTGDGETETVNTSAAPSFALEDYNGKTVSSSDFDGKILVVNAWASWCPFCVDELPDFAELQEAFPEEIAVIAINRAEPRATAQSFSDSLGLSDSYIFLLDPNDTFYKSIGGFSMPETIFIDTEGDVARHKRGPFKFPEMKEIVESILAEQG